jgi:hypothetical protein
MNRYLLAFLTDRGSLQRLCSYFAAKNRTAVMLQKMLFCAFQDVGMPAAERVRLRVIEPEIVRDFLELLPH